MMRTLRRLMRRSLCAAIGALVAVTVAPAALGEVDPARASAPGDRPEELRNVVLAKPAASGQTMAREVTPITWSRFTRGLPDDAQSERLRRILLNTNRYALLTWFPETYGSQDDYYLDLGGTGEASIRPPGSEALALAASLATGAYDEDVAGAPAEEAREVAVRITASIAALHKANRQNGWGDAWQSALWAYNAAFAGWLLWDDLPAADKENLARMVAYEADRFLFYEVPYYQLPDGTIVTPGDTKAEENAWNAAFLNLAVSMMPHHPNRAVWQHKAIELMVSAYSRPADLHDDTSINGKPVSQWLNGSNIADDGTLVNHNRIHPDYFTSIANSAGAPIAYGLAGLPTPKAAFWNAALVYDTLVDHEFTAPPYAAPGGTIYRRGENGEAIADIYYPQGNDWGTHRQMNFLLLDTLAATYGFGDRASVPPLEWAEVRAERMLQMQGRFDDGRTYGDPSEDTYSGREQWVALLAGRAYLTAWLDHNATLEVTNRAYPVTPRDYPGAELSIEAAASFPRGQATPLTLTVRSTSEEPLKDVSLRLLLPAGWEATPTEPLQPGATVPPGESMSVTWEVTPGPSVTDETAVLTGTVEYRHYGRHRQLEARAYVNVPPGRNVALGKPVTVSSMLRPTAGGDKVVDGLFTDASRWLSAEDDPAPELTIDLGDPVAITGIAVFSGYNVTNHDPTSTLKDFAIEVRTADGWQTVATVEDNVEHRVLVKDLDVTADEVRLAISDPSDSTIDVARVFEVEVYEAP